jgi:hypothetical protein
VDKSKGHAERVSDGGGSLGTTCVRGNYDSLLVVGDVELDVFTEEVTPVEVIDRDIEESLVLRV